MKALITGASRGLGLALARALARDGWDLILDARTPEPLAAVAHDLGATAIPGDITDPTHRAALANAVSPSATPPSPDHLGATSGPADATYRAALANAGSPGATPPSPDDLGATGIAGDRAGLVNVASPGGTQPVVDGLDLLVNNASTLGAVPLRPLAGYPLEELERAFAVNTLAPLALVQVLLPALRERRGAILNITSDAATEPYEGWGGYGATKAALEQISNVLAAEEPSLAVWWVDPGEMRTRMLADAGEDLEAAREPEEVVPALLKLIADRPASGRHVLR